jgi:hypothetical protein
MESRTVEMTEFKENADGSATVTFNFNDEEIQGMFRMGVIQAIKGGLKEAKQYDPDFQSKFNTKQVELTWDQIDSIVIGELKGCYETQMEHDPKSRDYELIHALSVMLKYYMHYSDYDEWFNTMDHE